MAMVMAATLSCGQGESQTRKPDNGGTFVPQPRASAAPATLGSREGGEIQGVKERYVVSVGLNLRVNLSIQHPNKRTARQVVFSTLGDTIPPVNSPPNYNSAIIDVALAGAPEGVHEATIVAIYDGNEPGEPVNFQVQVGSSTAPARRAPSQGNPTEVQPPATEPPAQNPPPQQAPSGAAQAGPSPNAGN
jgi:hypothetical protein